jgi:tRNA(Ile)-lysidine synthase
LRHVAAETRADLIATAHTADDQAETVLMRLARGAGTTGVAAMRALSDSVWRPLLGVRRSELRNLCHARGWQVVSDPANLDRRHERSRIRMDVLPLLGERAVPALARAARLAADDDDLLEQLVCDAPIEQLPDGTVAIPFGWLSSIHRALGRRALRRACRLVGAEYLPSAARIDDALTGKPVDLGGGLRCWRRGDRLVVGRSARIRV